MRVMFKDRQRCHTVRDRCLAQVRMRAVRDADAASTAAAVDATTATAVAAVA